MKKTLLILLCISCNIGSIAKTLHVGKGKFFTSIIPAIEAANMYDTVIVHEGIYYEKNIQIKKPIVLKGINHPVLDGERKYEIISVKANNVTISGFKLIRSGISSIEDFGGIKMYRCNNVVIENNILNDTFFGIYALQCNNCTIQQNTLTASRTEEQQSGNGIHCFKSDSMKIISNKINGHRDGIYFEFVTNSIIWRNTSYKNIRYGLHFMFSHSNSYITNIFENNGAGVAVMYSHGVKMFNNYFIENWGNAAYGLLLKEISDSYISGNFFEKNTSGIYMEGASRITVDKNNFISNGWALKIQASCMDINVERNNFINNTFDVGTNGSLVLNKFYRNFWDKYEGYDLNKNKIGDIPYRPVSLYSMIIEKNPPAMMLFRSFITTLMDKTEKIIPGITPENLVDTEPMMKKLF